MPARRDVFTTIRSEGALVPPDFLQRIAEGDKDISGLDPAPYHLQEREKLSEAITRSWNRPLSLVQEFLNRHEGHLWGVDPGVDNGRGEADPRRGGGAGAQSLLRSQAAARRPAARARRLAVDTALTNIRNLRTMS